MPTINPLLQPELETVIDLLNRGESFHIYDRIENLNRAYALRDAIRNGLAFIPEEAKALQAPVKAEWKTPERKETGKRVKVFGFPATAVIRWCGKEGWVFDETALALLTLGANMSDVTIRLQLKAGRDGERGAPADLTPAQVKTLRQAAQ